MEQSKVHTVESGFTSPAFIPLPEASNASWSRTAGWVSGGGGNAIRETSETDCGPTGLFRADSKRLLNTSSAGSGVTVPLYYPLVSSQRDHTTRLIHEPAIHYLFVQLLQTVHSQSSQGFLTPAARAAFRDVVVSGCGQGFWNSLQFYEQRATQVQNHINSRLAVNSPQVQITYDRDANNNTAGPPQPRIIVRIGNQTSTILVHSLH